MNNEIIEKENRTFYNRICNITRQIKSTVV